MALIKIKYLMLFVKKGLRSLDTVGTGSNLLSGDNSAAMDMVVEL